MDRKEVYVTRFAFAQGERLQNYIRVPELETPIPEQYPLFGPRRGLAKVGETLLVYKPHEQRDLLFSFLWYINGKRDPRLRSLGSVFRLAKQFTLKELADYLGRDEDIQGQRMGSHVVLVGERLTERMFHEIGKLNYQPILI